MFLSLYLTLFLYRAHTSPLGTLPKDSLVLLGLRNLLLPPCPHPHPSKQSPLWPVSGHNGGPSGPDLSSSCVIAQHTVCWTLARSSQGATRRGWPLMPSLNPTGHQSTNWMPHLLWMNIHICNPFANKGLSSRCYGFPSSHVWIWELDYKDGWAPKNWCLQIVVLEKTLEISLDCKGIKPVNPKGNQLWICIGRTDAEAEAPIVWPPDAKSRLIGKDPDSGKDWRQEEKRVTEDGMVTQWTSIWAHSWREWRTRKPGALQSKGSQCQTQLSDSTTIPFDGWLKAGPHAHPWTSHRGWRSPVNLDLSCTVYSGSQGQSPPPSHGARKLNEATQLHHRESGAVMNIQSLDTCGHGK